MSISYGFESWKDFWRDAEAIVYNEHQPETNRQSEYSGPFAVEMYEALDATSCLDILVARDGPYIVGYHVAMVLPAPHGTDTLCGFTSFYFVRRAYRGQGIGSELFERSAANMKGRGVARIFTPSRAHSPHTNQLKRLGWQDYEVTLMRKL